LLSTKYKTVAVREAANTGSAHIDTQSTAKAQDLLTMIVV
jgi:hypothetical protein